ncbi:hypothetical protein Tco_0439896 [Tanacetum coccineum]
MVRDPHSTATEFNAEVCDFLATHPVPFQKFVEPFLCLVGISHYYDLDENVYPTFLTTDGKEMDLFAFIRHADPTKVRIGERQIKEGQTPLLDSTKGRAISLVVGDDQGGPSVPVGHGDHNDDVDNVGIHDLNAEGGDTELRDQTEEGGTKRKRKAAGDASGSNLPPKKLREDHSSSSDAGASTVGKSLAALQGLLERSTLAVEISVTAAATVLFVTSSVTHTPKHEGDAEVTSIVRSFIPPPLVMTAAVATTAVVGTSSAHVLGAGTGPAI